MRDTVSVYCIDDRDVVLGVSGGWGSFARANGWGRGGCPENVVGRVLWDFIQGAETRHLYAELFREVRSGKTCGPIPFRCDSPGERRFLELVMSPLTDRRIEITSTIVRAEPRDNVGLLDIEVPRSNDLVRMCSMCKRIDVARDNWVGTEEGVVKLRLFEANQMPGLTHGVCPSCFQVAMSELDRTGRPVVPATATG